jgi:apolipoprotein N-acyltransferase
LQALHAAATAAAAVLSAVLLWIASPAVGAGWLAWVALVPVAYASLRRGESRAARAAVPLAFVLYLELLLVPALPFGIARDQWGEPPIPILVGDSPVVLVALVAVPLFGLLLYALRFPYLVEATRLPPALVVLVPALAWTALDVLRTKLDPSGAWGPLFLSQDDTPAATFAVLAGPWLITFAVVGINWAFAVLAARGRRGIGPAALAAALVAVLGATAALSAPGIEGVRIAVAAVQPGYDTAEFDRPVLRYLRKRTRNLERASLDLAGDLAPLTREAADRGAAVVVWPEGTVWVDPRLNGRVRQALSALAAETDAAIVVPYFLRSQARGATVVVLPSGELTPPQPKQRPMWFLGERGWPDLAPRPVEAGGVALGAMLGVDNQDPASARVLVEHGARLLAASTHDLEELAPHQSALARLHAAGLALPVVRADWRYGSAIVRAGGETAAEADAGKRRAVVVAEVEVLSSTTLYARVGESFAWAAVAAAVLAALASRLVVRRRASAG